MKTELQKQRKSEIKKAKSALKYSIVNSAFESFMYANGIEDSCVQLSPYHWRIKTYKATIDVWPGSKKFWIHGTGGSRIFDTIQELKQYLF